MATSPLHTIPAGVQQDIVSTLNLADGVEHEFQNRGSNPIRIHDGGSTAPDMDSGKEIPPLGFWTFTVASGTPFWVWGIGGPAILVYDDEL